MGAISLVAAPTAYAGKGCGGNFLTFPTWYDGLTDNKCDIVQPKAGKKGAGISKFVWRIVLNIIEIGLQVVAYAAAAFIIYGGFKYLTSTGTPDKTTAARKMILNAIVGLILSFMSIAIVNLIANNIKP